MNTRRLEELSHQAERKIHGAVSIREALKLADSFTGVCKAGHAIPVWALALRALAGGYRRIRRPDNGNNVPTG